MKRFFISLSILFHLFVLSRLPVFASSLLQTGLDNAASGAELPKLDIATIVGKMIYILISSVGIVFVIIIIYAGIIYLMAGGEPDKTKKAKNMITQGVVGIVLMISAYAITSFVLTSLNTTLNSSPPASTSPVPKAATAET